MDRIFYLDFVAVPIYAIILYATFVRRMITGPSNRAFTYLLIASLVTAVCDLITGTASANFPLSDYEVALVFAASTVYYVFHILVPILYLMFLFAETRMGYQMTRKSKLMIIFAPYAASVVLMIVNCFTGVVFTVTNEEGYQRGPGIYVFYVLAVMYSLWGVTYLLHRRKMFTTAKWLSLGSMYIMNGAAVIIQFLYPKLLIEMVMTALAELYVVLLVMRPEDYMDYGTGFPNFRAYKNELMKITSTGSRGTIIVLRFINARQMQRYLGDRRYFKFIRAAANNLKNYCDRYDLVSDVYFEQPGRIYIISDNYDFDFEKGVRELYAEVISDIAEIESLGAKVIPRFCEIRYPDDIRDAETIINIGHQFHRIIPFDQFYTHAKEIIDSPTFRVKNNMDLILNRAISEKKFEMYYQPIYSVKEKRFVSAEALIRLKDEEFGFVSPAEFIPAAERRGLMVTIGDFVLEDVFRFISETDFRGIGLSYVELNLSVAQCVQGDLADKILALEKKYHVNPERVNLEITETTYENIGDTTDMNIRTLSENGFSFSLDDYGTGYSNMQRISRLPLKIIKIDKTLVDDMGNKSGMSVMRNTVSMMKDIRKEIVCEGVETAEQLDILSSLGVDFIQGYYFSKPLPADSFVEFVKEKNSEQTA